ncbi:MAG: membrane dipeptidase [Alphaproteobacteria bacterium]
MTPTAERARALHRDSLIIDGTIAYCDGYTDEFLAGNVAAVNVTICNFQADFLEACELAAEWHARLGQAGSRWRLVERSADIPAARKEGKVGLIMGWQNLRPIEDKLARLALFHKAGLRMMQLTYNERNFVGDGCLEPNDGGLTPFGRRAIAEMNRLGIAVDLSHVGEKTCLGAVEASSLPVLLTHANARAVSNTLRNKSDHVIKAVAATGGLVGVSIHGALCWRGDSSKPPSVEDFIANLDHMVDLVGIDHVALGTDFVSVSEAGQATLERMLRATRDRYPTFISKFVQAFGNDKGARYPRECPTPAHLHVVTEALVGRGWSDDAIRKVLGGNLMRVLPIVWREV